jgi:hypothetical protein
LREGLAFERSIERLVADGEVQVPIGHGQLERGATL